MSEFSHKLKVKMIKEAATASSQGNPSHISDVGSFRRGPGSNIGAADNISIYSSASGPGYMPPAQQDVALPYNHTVNVPSMMSMMNGYNINHKSKSMKASEASLALKRSNIQQEAKDMMIRQKISRPYFGAGRKPFMISICCYVTAFFLFLIGLIVTCLAAFGNIFMPMDREEFIGPGIIALSIMVVAAGIKFSVDAYRYSEKSRKLIRFEVKNENVVKFTKKKTKSKTMETLLSGTKSELGISRKLEQ